MTAPLTHPLASTGDAVTRLAGNANARRNWVRRIENLLAGDCRCSTLQIGCSLHSDRHGILNVPSRAERAVLRLAARERNQEIIQSPTVIVDLDFS
jgi:hypothetical protein